jgi:hypothetical protein
MLDRSPALRAFALVRLARALPFAGLLGVAVASCSGTNDGNGNGAYYGGNGSPATVVSTCDMICDNVVGQCAGAVGLLPTCTSACGDLNLLPLGCLNPFLSYLTCVAGATQVTCNADGTYVLITPQACEADREATLDCNASPGLVAACVSLPGNTSCSTSPDIQGTTPEFCVGAPNGCASPATNPLGIGIYCCD